MARQRSIILVLSESGGSGAQEQDEIRQSISNLEEEIEREGRNHEQRISQLRKQHEALITLNKKFKE